MNQTRIALCILTCFLHSLAYAQEGGMNSLALEDLTDFNTQAGNWQIVGAVAMDPTADIHAQAEVPKKKRKSEPAPGPIQVESGTGVLINLPDEGRKDHLVTSWTHGDIVLELEVMLPRGSNSGIYLQGRYEIQLLDSWGVKNPGFSDIGGIYRNWESDPELSYMGKAPLANAAKAPGLWQKMKIAFRAPRFDENGNKISNARIVSAELNGVQVHDNVEIPRPTGGPLENNEVAEGPIMIQGDHGPVAFRNVRYKRMKESEIALSGLTYALYEGKFDNQEALLASEVIREGSIPLFTYEVAERDNDFGIVYKATLEVPEADRYTFKINTGGYGSLKIDGNEEASGGRAFLGTLDLEEGTYPLELVYYKSEGWRDPALSVVVSGQNTYAKKLHSFSSYVPGRFAVAPILVSVKDQPRLLRAFLDFEGDKSQRLSHTIGVGEPGGIHYVYDLKAGNLACVWKGGFIDATPMWHDRGDGSFVPTGMVQYLFTGPALAVLADPGAAFPVSAGITPKGYQLDEDSRPTFQYRLGDAEVEDRIYPGAEVKTFFREVTVKNPAANTFAKVATGKTIALLPNGWYVVDQEYYIRLVSGEQPQIRSSGTGQELILPIGTTPLKYELTW